MITKSCDCHITEDRGDQAPGSIVYQWDGEGRQFPQDVIRLYIRMLVTWRDVCRLKNEEERNCHLSMRMWLLTSAGKRLTKRPLAQGHAGSYQEQ